MALLFLPIIPLAPKLYSWMTADPRLHHALEAKLPIFTVPMFYVVSAFCFGVSWLLTNRLRYWSLEQDKTGAAHATHRMRFYSGIGVVLFALSLTFAAILWMMALQYQWYSTMYGVYYFAGGTWTALATVYVLTMALQRQGLLAELIQAQQYYYIGSLLFAFTVFYAYIHFAQYLHHLERQHAGRDLLVCLARKRRLVVRRPGHHLRPFLRPVPGPAAHRCEALLRLHGPALPLVLAYALGGPLL